MRNRADFTIETKRRNERAKPPNVPQKRNNTGFAFYKLTPSARATNRSRFGVPAAAGRECRVLLANRATINASRAI
jgi:hypothetical protein